jgi:hypothetical protein
VAADITVINPAHQKTVKSGNCRTFFVFSRLPIDLTCIYISSIINE